MSEHRLKMAPSPTRRLHKLRPLVPGWRGIESKMNRFLK